MSSLYISENIGSISYTKMNVENAKALLIIAHGAGAGKDHPFMIRLSEVLSSYHINTLRFNFPYMEQGRKSPGSSKNNLLAWEKIIELAVLDNDLPLFIGGKSYGGRMASHVLAENDNSYIKGIIYFGFPLHAPGKDATERADHLKDIKTPQLFIQGESDKLANILLINDVVNKLKMGTINIIPNADHSFKTPKKYGKTIDQTISDFSSFTSEWIKKQIQ